MLQYDDSAFYFVALSFITIYIVPCKCHRLLMPIGAVGCVTPYSNDNISWGVCGEFMLPLDWSLLVALALSMLLNKRSH